MKELSRRSLLASTVALTACSQGFVAAGASPEVFVCPPCGCSEDDTEFESPGRCPDCDMTLIPKQESDLGFTPAALPLRAGSFEIAGGVGKEDHRVKVHYYLPDGFTPQSKILLVVPGAGRNSFQYRNEWLDVARKKNILIAALGYPEEQYDLAAYHMGGVIKNLSIQNVDRQSTGAIQASDDDIVFDVNSKREEWLFNDFDRIFELLKTVTGSTRSHYDIFGHSAGGQILHRMALFHPTSKAKKIIAANAGWYTLPDRNMPLPTGLQGSPITDEGVVRSLSSGLTILLGENDNSDEAGGTLLHTPTVDQQGLGRLSRGQYFYNTGKVQAESLEADFRWRLNTVANVGHDFREMSKAAAGIMFE